ncbi:Cation/multidrug efflux pump [Hyella patelloides LEGE 07179]|uniref:Cation/multidrug efflux pump n=1 Tax=Hyella patelloides LEGE 07179 TaxID=945734 RepID=A0A563VK29_9CYAN|nr:efflux RND transporter permease subunit [Hyella patelloides]VEP11830.1 Cation/multidrug efflux pump [Hyella patelloides LEGE 07179]
MSFHLSAWSIKNPIPTVVTFLILGIIGITSFLSLGIDDTPNIDISAVSVKVTQRGASPTELETQVTKKIEDAVANLDNIDEISSTITEGRSTTVINFALGTDSNQATDDVRNAVSQIRSDLPQDVNEPIVNKLSFSGGTVIAYAVESEKREVADLSNLVDLTIIPQLLNIQGVGQIDRWGGKDREIRVDLNPERLLAYKISASEVNQQIRNYNINLAGGKTKLGGREQNVRTLGSARTVRDIQRYPIRLDNGGRVRLSKLGTVRDSFAESTQTAYLNGKSVVAFAVKRSTGSTLVKVEEDVREAVAKLQTTLPEDIKLQTIFTRADSIRGSYDGTVNALIFGCGLTVLTVGIFLRDWRATIITATALPLSIIPTFWVMKSFNYTLNGMTLLALALAIGNLVDDAICMLENIDRHLQMGKKPLKAALDGAKEIGLAVVATTATIVAVFVPVAFMGGIPGQFFQPFGMTVAVSTMFSTLVACTVTPMMSAYLLKVKSFNVSQGMKIIRCEIAPSASQVIAKAYLNELLTKGQPVTNTFASQKKARPQPYRDLLRWALTNRITTLVLAALFFFASLQLVPFIPKGLFSSSDTGLSTIVASLPPGSPLENTEKLLLQISNTLEDNSAVERVLVHAGSESVNSGTIYVKLLPKTERKISQQQFQEQMRDTFQTIPGAKISFRSQGAGGGNKDVSLVLRSNNPTALAAVAQDLEAQMSDISGLVEIDSSLSLVKPELIIEPNAQRATDLGVSVQAIANTASLALIGDTDSNLAKFNLSDRQIPIRVQIDPKQRENIQNIQNLLIPGDNDRLVPLKSVARIRLGSGPAEIERFNRNRRVTVEANLQGISLGNALTRIRALPTINPLPPEVSEEPSGDAEIMRDIFSRFGSALALAILCIYAILVLLYNNFFYPLAILVALPLSVGGALLGLLITQKELGLFALIGIVLLMGLVTKNAILLVDFALAGIQQGRPQFKAVVEAGVSRLRPILMTSISTIAGMMPIALELGADGEVRSPMAIAVIGGFTTSTLLTLVVVPVLFTYIDNLCYGLAQLFRRIRGENIVKS